MKPKAKRPTAIRIPPTAPANENNGSKIGVRLQISFPYRANPEDGTFDRLCWLILAAQRGRLRTLSTPLMIVNVDSLDEFKAFRAFAREKKHLDIDSTCDIRNVYSVDTCQMWLHGFGVFLDANRDPAGARQLGLLHVPGDLKRIESNERFLRGLNDMIARVEAKDGADFVVGDFDINPKEPGVPSAKALIDIYGTYPLMYNWFPSVAADIRRLGVQRPRSEFFAASTSFLETWLQRRKFAYEQTLAFLIYAFSWDPRQTGRVWRVEKVDIGVVADIEDERGFRQATDQVERTERVIRLLWREDAERSGISQDVEARDFLVLDHRSTSIRVNAIICFKNILTPAAAGHPRA
ncbi:MAG TPA: hypothetical protein VMF91_19950 [Bryobacteraceae bacterium]|nr:hypothetical protein [Bryobacteraceae bacterium]